MASDQPNIVFVIADDCTFRDLGCYGGQAHTPNIDRLATEGMLFERCFQSAPMCSPTRHNIYTGLYPVKSGAYPNHTRVDPGTKSIVQYLRPLGYEVAHSGKSHVNPASVFAWKHFGKDKSIDFDSLGGFISECKADSKPFCLLLCSNEPHTPWNKGDRTRYPDSEIELPPYIVDTPETRDGMARYLAEITYFDGQVGDSLELLDKHGVADNTLVMVVSEQGNALPFAKWTCYDSGLQSACIVRWPGKVKPESTNSAMIEYVDFLPTFVEAAGGMPSEDLDGKSLVEVLNGRQDHKEFVFGEMTTRGINSGSEHFGIRSVRSEKFKYIWNFTPEIEFKNACTKADEFQSWVREAEGGNEKAQELVKRYQYRPEIELYDVVADPLEMNNLADAKGYEEIKHQLRDELDAWMFRCGDEGQATELKAMERQGAKR
ncbi:MAG: sulfatase, partial [Planctomycetota bacterium]